VPSFGFRPQRSEIECNLDLAKRIFFIHPLLQLPPCVFAPLLLCCRWHLTDAQAAEKSREEKTHQMLTCQTAFHVITPTVVDADNSMPTKMQHFFLQSLTLNP
jgi:hypothetical protein